MATASSLIISATSPSFATTFITSLHLLLIPITLLLLLNLIAILSLITLFIILLIIIHATRFRHIPRRRELGRFITSCWLWILDSFLFFMILILEMIYEIRILVLFVYCLLILMWIDILLNLVLSILNQVTVHFFLSKYVGLIQLVGWKMIIISWKWIFHTFATQWRLKLIFSKLLCWLIILCKLLLRSFLLISGRLIRSFC